MPTSGMKFVNIHGSDGTLYIGLAFKFGGDEFYEKAGFGKYQYIAYIMLDKEARVVLIDTTDGFAGFALEQVRLGGKPVLEAGWATLLRDFEVIPEEATIVVELTSGEPKVSIKNELEF